MASFSSKVLVLALWGGAAALVAGVGIALLGRRFAWRPVPVAGLLLVLVAAVGLDRVPSSISPAARKLNPLWDLPRGLAIGLVVLAAGAFVAELLPPRRTIGVVVALAGAWIIATQSALPDILWIRIATGATIVAGSALLAEFDRRWRDSAIAVPLVAVSAAGVYLAVPETTQAAVLLASTAPLILLAWPRPVASLGGPGAFATTGLLAWTVAAGGLGRPPSIVGGLMCLGLLAVEPLARVLDHGRISVLDLAPRRWRLVAAIMGQVALVFVSARVVGRVGSVAGAAVVALTVLIAAVVFSVGAIRIARRLGSSRLTDISSDRQ